MINVFLLEEDGILNEYGNSFQDEGEKELDVDIIPGTAESPVRKEDRRLK